MKPRVTYPDAERLVVDYLAAELAALEPAVTVGVGVPTDWTPTQPPHVSIVSDGTPWLRTPVAVRTTIRCTVRARTTSEAKRVAWVAHGVLLAHPGGGGVTGVRRQIGVMPVRDPVTDVECAWFAVGVTVRGAPIPT